MLTENVRQCTGCKRTLPLTEFILRSGKTAEQEGRVGKPYGRCKTCNRTRTIKRLNGNMEHALSALLWAGGGRSNKKHGRGDLTPDFLFRLYVQQSGKCAVSGVELTYERGEGRVETNVSLDRIDNSLGYTEKNVQLVCLKANEMKGSSDYVELVDWCTAIIEHLGRPRQ